MGCLIGVLAEQGQCVLWHYEKTQHVHWQETVQKQHGIKTRNMWIAQPCKTKANGPNHFHFLLKVFFTCLWNSSLKAHLDLKQLLKLATVLLTHCFVARQLQMSTPIERNGQSKITLHLAILVGVTCNANSDKIINYTYE